jgi:hypothetical protein
VGSVPARGRDLVRFEPFADTSLAGPSTRAGYARKIWYMTRAWLTRLPVVRRAAEFDVVYLFRERW